MRKMCLFTLVSILCVALAGCSNDNNKAHANEHLHPTDNSDAASVADEEKTVQSIVQDFGKTLQMVSLLAPDEIVSSSMEENYGDFVSPALLAHWQKNPQQALGRKVSSPWPDRIEVLSVEQLSKEMYRVRGEIVEITSVEQANGGGAARQNVTFEVKKLGDRWLIDTAALGDDTTSDSISYENADYGFGFTLPKSWKDYTVVTDKWEGVIPKDPDGEQVVETGPMISIRHPEWTEETPRQDIPIMIFTSEQWNSLQQEALHIGAAPIGPGELGRNSKYVFALPVRYNYAFLTGFEEVEAILKDHMTIRE